jgi:tetratricopeptide (TPR) repeat protein
MSSPLALVVALLTPALASPCEIRAPSEQHLTLLASVSTTSGRSPAAHTRWRSDFDGTLYVWAAHPTPDLELTVCDAGGRVLARDDDAGTRAPRFAKVEVVPGADLELWVAGACESSDPSRPNEACDVVLTLMCVAESEAARRAAEIAAAELAAIEILPADATSVERLAHCIDRLLAVEHASESTRIVDALWKAGVALEDRDRADLQLKAFAPCLEHGQRIYPLDHPDLQVTRERVASALADVGRFEEADALYALAVAGWLRAGWAESLNLQRTRATWASMLSAHGESARAIEIQNAALEVLARTRPEDDFDRLAVQMNAGTSLLRARNFDAACKTLREVVRRLERSRPDDDPFRLRAEMNLGSALYELGDAAGARECFERVLAVREEKLPRDHPDVLRAKMNLAVVYKESGDIGGALTIEREVLDGLSRALPGDAADVQNARRNLANSLELAGRYDEARALVEEVLSVYERTRPLDDPDFAGARHGLASILKKQGELAAALAIEAGLVDARERTRPIGHSDRVTARRNLAWSRAMSRDREGLEREIQALIPEIAAALHGESGGLSIREAEERALALRPALSAVLSLCDGAGFVEPIHGRDGDVLSLVESVRGVGLQAAAVLRSGSDAHAQVLRAELALQSEELAALVARRAADSEIAVAQRAREALERELAEQSSAGARGLETGLAGFAPAADEAVLAFVRYMRHRADATVPGGLAQAEHMCVFVVDAHGVTRVELGPLDALVELVAGWRAAIGSEAPDRLARGQSASASAPIADLAEAIGRELTQRILGPLDGRLRDMSRLTLVLDDALCLLPIDALPYVKGCVGDRWSIRVRSTVAPGDEVKRGTTLPRFLALGAIDYDDPPLEDVALARAASPSPSPSVVSTTRDALRSGVTDARFGPLPATGAEVRAIEALCANAFGESARLDVLAERRASKHNLAQLAPRATHIHLATHGYILEAPRSESGDAWNERVRGLTPLLACGLAFAGANVAEDALGRLAAVVSGEELASFDLSHCELAVLSACETNVGVRRAGQGVASLQKALHMAGARSAITSLWKVPDVATKELMVDFYRRMWVEKKPKHQALWEAKTMLREAKDERGTLKYTTRDWAAWVLTGSPR